MSHLCDVSATIYDKKNTLMNWKLKLRDIKMII